MSSLYALLLKYYLTFAVLLVIVKDEFMNEKSERETEVFVRMSIWRVP